MKHLDLFSGIGGFALAASWVWGEDHEVVCFCEMDKFCQKILNKHWPGVPIIDDIKNFSLGGKASNEKRWEKKNLGSGIDASTNVDLLTAGVP